jgi:hypothetical protein
MPNICPIPITPSIPWSAILHLGIFPIPRRSSPNARVLSVRGAGSAFHGGTILAASASRDCSAKRLRRSVRQHLPTCPPASMLRFSDTEALQALLTDAGLYEIIVQDHAATHIVPDVDTLWRGGLGSFAVTASAIAHQYEATQQAIRSALVRRAEPYRTPDGLVLPTRSRQPRAESHRSRQYRLYGRNLPDIVTFTRSPFWSADAPASCRSRSRS